MHVNIVQASPSLEVQVDESMLVVRNDAIHQGGHQAVVTHVDRLFLLQFVREIDAHFQVAG